ncbi:MAG: hypothetical protein LBH46_00715 [Rickettsiales bacterium]|jgi:hypothetical protein|nr:hypothetical protein [Rickettsiales bacterium]
MLENRKNNNCLITIREFAEEQGISYENAKKQLAGVEKKFAPSKKEVSEGKVNLYDMNDIINFLHGKEQKKLYHVDKKASKLASKESDGIIANAFLKQQQDRLSDLPVEVKENTFNIIGALLDTLDKYNDALKTNNCLQNKNKELENDVVNKENTIDDFKAASASRIAKKELRTRIVDKINELSRANNCHQKTYNKLYGYFKLQHPNISLVTHTNKLDYLINHGYGDELLEILLMKF